MIDYDILAIGGHPRFCDEAFFYQSTPIPDGAGSPVPWVYFLSSRVAALLFADGFWDTINSEFGTMFDLGEEEELGVTILGAMADRIEQLAHERYGAGETTETVGWRADRSPVVVTLECVIIRKELIGLATFLRRTLREGHGVMAML